MSHGRNAAEVATAIAARLLATDNLSDVVSDDAAIANLVDGATTRTPILTDTIPFRDVGVGGGKTTPQGLLNLLTSLAANTTLIDGDQLMLSDSAASNVAKKITWSDFKTTLAASDSAAGVVEYASTTEMESASSNVRVVTPGRQHRHPASGKCWAKVSVSAGVPSISASYNITSITDTAQGRLTITIGTDFSTASWCCTATVERALGTGWTDQRVVGIQSGLQAAGSVVLLCYDTTNTGHVLKDPVSWHMLGLGDQ